MNNDEYFSGKSSNNPYSWEKQVDMNIFIFSWSDFKCHDILNDILKIGAHKCNKELG